jgi:hypothetical protein
VQNINKSNADVDGVTVIAHALLDYKDLPYVL